MTLNMAQMGGVVWSMDKNIVATGIFVFPTVFLDIFFHKIVLKVWIVW